MKTLAALLVQTGQPLELAEISIPALKPAQALVRTDYSGACRTQVLEIRGAKGEDKWVPHCLGHEGTGEVLEVGSSVSRVKPGDKVVLSWLKAGGLDAGGTQYDWAGRNVNAGGVTTFQKHTVVSENRLTLLPPGLDPREGIMLGCALPTGFGCVINTGRAAVGESVAVFGAGGIGQAALMGAAAVGCYPIIAVDVDAKKLELAKLAGASHLVNPAETDPVAAIREITGGAGADLAIEATGIVDIMTAALSAVRPQGGRAVIAGNAHHEDKVSFSPALLNQGKSLMGTWGGDSQPDRDFPKIAKLMLAGKVDVKPLLSASYRLEDINAAIDDLEAGRVGRPVIDMTAS